MRLLVLMFHLASPGRHGNSAAMLDAHFDLVSKRYHCVLPGEPLVDDKLNVCLTFDDGTIDFYAIVYPLLRKHGLRALLAVPVASVGEAVPALAERLEACAARAPDAEARGGHCTWEELAEMAGSDVIKVAAHGLTHCRLDQADVDLHAEIVVPQTILAAYVGRPIDSFVLPFGRFSPEALALARLRYRHVFRIGSADNAGWGAPLLYRVDADEMTAPEALFSRRRLAGYRLRRHWNALRRR